MRKHRSTFHNTAAPMVAVAVGLLWGLAANTACACERSTEDGRSYLCEGADSPEDAQRWQARVTSRCGEIDLLQVDRSVLARRSVAPLATTDHLELHSGGAPSDRQDDSDRLHLVGRLDVLHTLGPVPPAHGPPLYLVAPSHSPPAVSVG